MTPELLWRIPFHEIGFEKRRTCSFFLTNTKEALNVIENKTLATNIYASEFGEKTKRYLDDFTITRQVWWWVTSWFAYDDVMFHTARRHVLHAMTSHFIRRDVRWRRTCGAWYRGSMFDIWWRHVSDGKTSCFTYDDVMIQTVWPHQNYDLQITIFMYYHCIKMFAYNQ